MICNQTEPEVLIEVNSNLNVIGYMKIISENVIPLDLMLNENPDIVIEHYSREEVGRVILILSNVTYNRGLDISHNANAIEFKFYTNELNIREEFYE